MNEQDPEICGLCGLPIGPDEVAKIPHPCHWPGERVPVDGEILEGRSAIDESMVTGESLPVSKDPGAKVIAGTLNQTGALVIEAKRVGRDTMLSQIVQLVADAQRRSCKCCVRAQTTVRSRPRKRPMHRQQVCWLLRLLAWLVWPLVWASVLWRLSPTTIR